MSEKDSRGQAILIIALLLVVLIALMALVIDGGNAYAQRRRAQNAVDSSVLAGAQELTKVIVPGVTHQEIWAQIEDYAVLNGLDAQPVADYVDAWFIDDAGEELLKVNPGSAALVSREVEMAGETREISGVKVEGALPFDTFFARIVGFDELTVHADAKAWILCGACSGANLFPVAVSTDTFDITGEWPLNVTVDYTITHRLWERQPDEGNPTLYPGNFGWVNWEPKSPYPQGPSSTVLAENIAGDDRSGLWAVWEWLHAATGQMVSQPVISAVESRIGDELIVPIYGAVRSPHGTNLEYQIWGFASFELTCFHYHKNKELGTCEYSSTNPDDRWIEGRFHRFFANLDDIGGCPDFGLCAVKLRRPIPETSP